MDRSQVRPREYVRFEAVNHTRVQSRQEGERKKRSLGHGQFQTLQSKVEAPLTPYVIVPWKITRGVSTSSSNIKKCGKGLNVIKVRRKSGKSR
jgi:hypothetical protein